MAEIEEGLTFRYSHPHRAGLARLGNLAVPREVEVQVTSDEEPSGRRRPDARFRFEMVDGAAVCTEAHITSKPGDRPIRTNDLLVFNLDALAEEAFVRFAMLQTGDGAFTRSASEPTPGAQQAVHAAVERGFGDSHAELLEVSRVYLDPAARRKPTDSVMEVLGYGSRATASRKVRQARERGLIPEPGATEAELSAARARLTAQIAERQQQADDDALRREAREWARTNPQAAMDAKAAAWQRRQDQTTASDSTGEDGDDG